MLRNRKLLKQCLHLGLLKKYVYIYIYLFIYLFAVLGLCCCARAFFGCGERGLLFVAVHGLLVVASLVVEHGF